LIAPLCWWENLDVPPYPGKPDPFLSLGESLRELEVTVGPKARPAIGEVRARLAEAVAMREGGDMPGALRSIALAMRRLAALASEVDPEEGTVMRFIAENFTRALGIGDKDRAKEAVNFIRHKAGDPEDDENTDW
jgi:hypothetical protein